MKHTSILPLLVLMLVPLAPLHAYYTHDTRVIEQSPDVRPKSIDLILKDHRFIPSAFTLMPGEKIILRIINHDDSAEQFESRYLNRQKVIPGKSAVDISIGPLKPGVYDFTGNFHADTAQGRITVPQLGWGESYKHQK